MYTSLLTVQESNQYPGHQMASAMCQQCKWMVQENVKKNKKKKKQTQTKPKQSKTKQKNRCTFCTGTSYTRCFGHTRMFSLWGLTAGYSRKARNSSAPSPTVRVLLREYIPSECSVQILTAQNWAISVHVCVCVYAHSWVKLNVCRCVLCVCASASMCARALVAVCVSCVYVCAVASLLCFLNSCDSEQRHTWKWWSPNHTPSVHARVCVCVCQRERENHTCTNEHTHTKTQSSNKYNTSAHKHNHWCTRALTYPLTHDRGEGGGVRPEGICLAQ